MNKAEDNYQIIRQLQDGRDFLLAMIEQNPALLKTAEPRIRDLILSKIPARRLAEPDEMGPLAVYLASAASDFMTCQTVYIDGGETASW